MPSTATSTMQMYTFVSANVYLRLMAISLLAGLAAATSKFLGNFAAASDLLVDLCLAGLLPLADPPLLCLLCC